MSASALDIAESFGERVRALGLDPDAPDLEDQLVALQADRLDWLARRKRLQPLAFTRLWRSDTADCDQRRAAIAMLEARTVGVLLGGNRSGKSVACLQVMAANLLGGDHPAVIAWCELNDLPNTIPHGPGQIFISAPTSNDSLKFHREEFAALIGPSGVSWHNRMGKGEAVLRLRRPGHDVVGEAWFKAVDQGRGAYQGKSLRRAWFDEEPIGRKGREVFKETQLRVVDQGGSVLLSMYPANGLTWVYDDLVKQPVPGVTVRRLDAYDNPHLDKDELDALYASLSEQERERRRHGFFQNIEGLVYPLWQRSRHTCKPFTIPADWPRFRGGDFGLVNPTCILWGAIGNDHTLYVYRQHYAAGPTYEQHAQRVKELSAGERIARSWGDPSAKNVIEELWPLFDLYFEKANNEVKAGIDAVTNRLRVRADGQPRLVVFEDCVDLVRELEGYTTDPNAKDGEPLKKDDHAPDALRYLVMGVESYFGPRG